MLDVLRGKAAVHLVEGLSRALDLGSLDLALIHLGHRSLGFCDEVEQHELNLRADPRLQSKS